MFLLLEMLILAALFMGGCWSKRTAVVFLPIVAMFFAVFKLRIGNPIGLLASGGGWIILNGVLAIAVLSLIFQPQGIG